jgi:hypothetical protein
MSDEQNGTGNSVAAENQGTQQNNQNQAPSSSGQRNGVNEATTSSPSEENGEKKSVIPEATRKKYSHLESENARLKKELDETTPIKQTFEELRVALQSDPSAWESVRQARIKQGGSDLGSYESHFGTSKTSSKKDQKEKSDDKKDVSSQPTQPPTQDVVKTVKQEIEWDNGIREFNKSHPEFDPDNVRTKKDNAEVLKINRDWNRIAKIATALKSDEPNMSWGKALDDALYSLPENREKYVNKIKEQGKMVGQAEAYAEGAATASGMSGKSGGSSKKDYIEPYDDEIRKKFGLTKEQYLESRNRHR